MKLASKVKINNSKLIFLIAGVAIVLAVLIIGVLFWMIGNANAKYNQSLDQNSQSVKSSLISSLEDFKKLHNQPNATETLTEIDLLIKELADLQTKMPKESSLLGLRLEKAQNVELAAEIKHNIDDLSNQLKQTKAFIEYQGKINAALTTVSGKSGKNVTEQTALVKAWQDMLKKVQAITPTQPLTEVHKKLEAGIKAVIDSLAPLPGLYEKGDRTTFTAKQKQLVGKINALQELHTEIDILAAKQDSTLAQALQHLQNSLKKLNN